MEEERKRTRGRPAQPISDPDMIIKSVVLFLKKLMGEVLAKRIVSMVLIAIGMPNARIIELTGMSDRCIWSLRKAIRNDNIDNLFVAGHGGGRVGKAKGFEAAIAEELEKNNYHTHQQVADMILEKFGIKMSVSAVGKLLKKTASVG